MAPEPRFHVVTEWLLTSPPILGGYAVFDRKTNAPAKPFVIIPAEGGLRGEDAEDKMAKAVAESVVALLNEVASDS